MQVTDVGAGNRRGEVDLARPLRQRPPAAPGAAGRLRAGEGEPVDANLGVRRVAGPAHLGVEGVERQRLDEVRRRIDRHVAAGEPQRAARLRRVDAAEAPRMPGKVALRRDDEPVEFRRQRKRRRRRPTRRPSAVSTCVSAPCGANRARPPRTRSGSGSWSATVRSGSSSSRSKTSSPPAPRSPPGADSRSAGRRGGCSTPAAVVNASRRNASSRSPPDILPAHPPGEPGQLEVGQRRRSRVRTSASSTSAVSPVTRPTSNSNHSRSAPLPRSTRTGSGSHSPHAADVGVIEPHVRPAGRALPIPERLAVDLGPQVDRGGEFGRRRAGEADAIAPERQVLHPELHAVEHELRRVAQVVVPGDQGVADEDPPLPQQPVGERRVVGSAARGRIRVPATCSTPRAVAAHREPRPLDHQLLQAQLHQRQRRPRQRDVDLGQLEQRRFAGLEPVAHAEVGEDEFRVPAVPAGRDAADFDRLASCAESIAAMRSRWLSTCGKTTKRTASSISANAIALAAAPTRATRRIRAPNGVRGARWALEVARSEGIMGGRRRIVADARRPPRRPQRRGRRERCRASLRRPLPRRPASAPRAAPRWTSPPPSPTAAMPPPRWPRTRTSASGSKRPRRRRSTGAKRTPRWPPPAAIRPTWRPRLRALRRRVMLHTIARDLAAGMRPGRSRRQR